MSAEWLALDGAANARAVVRGVLLRADNLQSLSARDVHRLVEEELEVVLDLRTDVEVELEGPGPMTTAAEVRIEHHSLYPDTDGNTDVEAETIMPWKRGGDGEWREEAPAVRAYLSYLRRRPDSVVASIRTIARSHGAVLVHCAAGKDRTGVVIALALDAAGIDRGMIVSDYVATGERIEKVFARLRASATYRDELEGQDPRWLAPTAATMERFLEIVDERFGGALSWLSANGFSRADLERLRDRLTPALRAA